MITRMEITILSCGLHTYPSTEDLVISVFRIRLHSFCWKTAYYRYISQRSSGALSLTIIRVNLGNFAMKGAGRALMERQRRAHSRYIKAEGQVSAI